MTKGGTIIRRVATHKTNGLVVRCSCWGTMGREGWIGHTREVAREHFMSVPAEHIARAIAGESTPAGGEKNARKAAQSVHAKSRRTSQEPKGNQHETAFFGPKKGLRLRASTRGRKPYPQGESNPCLQDENLIS